MQHYKVGARGQLRGKGLTGGGRSEALTYTYISENLGFHKFNCIISKQIPIYMYDRTVDKIGQNILTKYSLCINIWYVSSLITIQIANFEL